MPKIVAFLLMPFSFLYGSVMAIRNLLFNIGLLEQYVSRAKIISVGNLSVGGTGKTPHVKWLVQELKGSKKVAVVSRGYGRKTKGYLVVDVHSSPINVGDEPLEIKQAFPDVKVVVCEKRKNAVQRLENEVEVIILDDAYQHRYVERDFNIMLTEFNNPYYKDYVLPSGRLREFRSGVSRADAVIFTKAPEESGLRDLKGESGVKRYVSRLQYVNPTFGKKVVLVTALAKPGYLKRQVSLENEVVEFLKFADHHNYSQSDIERIHEIFDNLATENKCIVCTEKDWVKLKDLIPLEYKGFWVVQKIEVEVENDVELIARIKAHVG